jgi:hypothetical protein
MLRKYCLAKDLKDDSKVQFLIEKGRDFQRLAPAKEKLVLNKSIRVLGRRYFPK